MRTTIDLPDELFKQAKASAALRGIKLRELIAECISQGLAAEGWPAAEDVAKKIGELIRSEIPEESMG